MGIVKQEARFQGVAPRIDQIANAIYDICGLPVSIENFLKLEKHELYDILASLSLACYPKNKVTVYAYRPGAVRSFYDKILGDTIPNFEKSLEGMNESPGEQSVFLTVEIEQQPSLFILTSLALENLGGQLRNVLSEEKRQEYNRQITPEMINNRRKKRGMLNLALGILNILFIPLLLVFGIIGAIVTFPFRIVKASKIGSDTDTGKTKKLSRK